MERRASDSPKGRGRALLSGVSSPARLQGGKGPRSSGHCPPRLSPLLTPKLHRPFHFLSPAEAPVSPQQLVTDPRHRAAAVATGSHGQGSSEQPRARGQGGRAASGGPHRLFPLLFHVRLPRLHTPVLPRNLLGSRGPYLDLGLALTARPFSRGPGFPGICQPLPWWQVGSIPAPGRPAGM